MVGVGDGPWDLMNQFDDHLPGRNFDNFQVIHLLRCAVHVVHTCTNKQVNQWLLLLRIVPYCRSYRWFNQSTTVAYPCI